MKLFKKVLASIILITLSSTPTFAYGDQIISTYSSNPTGQMINQNKEKITIYSGISDTTISTYVCKINGTIFIDYHTLADQLKFSYYEDKGYRIYDGDNYEEIFELRAGNKGTIFNNEYFLMSEAPIKYDNTLYVPLKSFVEGLVYIFKYDSNTGIYLMIKEGQSLPTVPVYPEKQISYNFGSKSKNINTVILGDRLCIDVTDLAELMNLECGYDGREEYGKQWYLQTKTKNQEGRYTSFNFYRDQGTTLFYTDGRDFNLPVAPFDYPCHGLYVPAKEFIEAFGYSFNYNANISTVIID